jgi:hypothetical protein
MVMDDNEINDNKKFRQITGHFEWSTFWALLEATGCQHQESDHIKLPSAAMVDDLYRKHKTLKKTMFSYLKPTA